MYKLKYVADDANKFTNTWIAIRGELVEARAYEHAGGGVYNVLCHRVRPYNGDDLKQEIFADNLRTKDGDVTWAPPLPTGYYNLKTKPWRCLWLHQAGTKQYRVGLNASVLKIGGTIGGKKPPTVTFGDAAWAYRDGFNSQPVKRGVSMIKKRANGVVGISPNLALLNHAKVPLVIYRCKTVIGLVHEGQMHIDATFNHPDLDNLEYEHGSAKELGRLWRLSAAAG